MRDNFVSVQNVPCGNIVAMASLGEVITNSSTLTNVDEVKAHPIRAMKFSVSPVVHYGFNVWIETIFQSLKKSLQLLDKYDLTIVCSIEEHSKAILAGPGVHHLDNCLIALKKFMVDVPNIIKDPVILCLESVIEKDSCAVKGLSKNRLNSLSMKAMPLGEEHAKANDEGRIGKVLAIGTNMLVSSCRNVNNLNDVQDSIDFGFQIASKKGCITNLELCKHLCLSFVSSLVA
jgi:elongation factor 2